MARVSKFTSEQKLEIALELLSGKWSHAELCRRHGISAPYAYKRKDRALELLRAGRDRAVERPNGKEAALQQRIEDLEQLAGDQALTIRALKKTKPYA